MPIGLLPTPASDGSVTTDPQATAEAFLDALAQSDLSTAMGYLADDVEYVNVGLPAIHGRSRVTKALSGLERPQVGFEVYLHAISADGPTVLTERTDVITVGALRIQFWVWGRFDVDGGSITLWRDSFDFLDMTKAMVRGLVGIVVPSLRPSPPEGQAPPGR